MNLDEYTEWFDSLSEEDQLYWEYGWFEDFEEESQEDCYTVCKE
jgi:hypothetical protein